MKVKIKKVYILIILLTIFGSAFFLAYKRDSVSAKVIDSSHSCPLEKEIPVGKLTDQTVSMSETIMENLKTMIIAANAEYQAGEKMVSLSNECKTDNCQSKCDPREENQCRSGAPTSCASGYHCEYTTCQQNGNSSTTKNDCTNLPSTTTIDADKYYYNATWCYKYCYDWYHSCSPCSPKGSCSVGWNDTIDVCVRKDCAGDACPFAELNAQAGIVVSQNSITIGAYNNINDIYTDLVSELDIIGEVCKNSFLGISCLPTPPKDTESKIIELYFGETKRNVYDCRILGYQSEEEIFRQDVGETIMSCKTLLELGILEKCYRNDFYCCQ